jgi:hypothetical protein
MKNNLTIPVALFFLLTVGIGCSFIDSVTSGGNSSNGATTSNSATNSAANPNDVSNTGIPECDEAIDFISNDLKSKDEGFVARKIREGIVDYAREEIKRNIEANQGDKQKIVEGCKKIKEDYVKNKDQNSNQNQKESEKSTNTQRF